MLRHAAKLTLALFAVVAAYLTLVSVLPRSVFYRDRRPTRAGRFANKVMALWGRYGGPPSWQGELETRSRKGRLNRIPIVVGAYEGGDYAVSMLGDRSVWVRNLRANGGHATLRHGRRRALRLIEVNDPKERAPIIKAYLQRAIGARAHIGLAPEAPLADFERIAAGYPVFRIVDAQPSAPISTLV